MSVISLVRRRSREWNTAQPNNFVGVRKRENWEKYRVEEPKPPTEITTVGLEKLPSGRELLPSNIIAFVAPGYFIVGVKRPQSAQNRPQIDLEGQKRYIFVFKKLSSASLFRYKINGEDLSAAVCYYCFCTIVLWLVGILTTLIRAAYCPLIDTQSSLKGL